MRSARLRDARIAIVCLILPATLIVFPAPAEAKEVIVNMRSFAFVPQGSTLQGNVTIEVGDTVTWVYAETATDGGCSTLNGPSPLPNCPGHSTTSAQGLWDSRIFGKSVPPSQVSYEGNRFSVKFDQPGTFNYFCIPHQNLQAPVNGMAGMKAAVIVQATAAGPAPGGGQSAGGGGNTGGTAETGSATNAAAALGLALVVAGLAVLRKLRMT